MTARKRWGQAATGSILAVGVVLATTNCSTTTGTTATTGTTTITPTKTTERAPAVAGTGSSVVNLTMKTATPDLVPGNAGLVTFTIYNTEASTTQGESILTYVTPFYVNIDRGQPLPDGCRFYLEDPDPTVPEMVRCTIPAGLEQNKEVKLSIPVVATTRARLVGTLSGLSIVTPAPGSPDRETDLTDSRTGAGVKIIPPTPKLPDTNIVGIYGTADRPTLLPDQSKPSNLIYGNVGPKDMTGEVAITYVTPFYVNFDRSRPLPEGCSFRLQDPDPAVPEVVTCKRPALAKGQEGQLQFHLVAVPGGPQGAQNGNGLAAPAGTSDADFDQNDNLVRVGAQIVAPAP